MSLVQVIWQTGFHTEDQDPKTGYSQFADKIIVIVDASKFPSLQQVIKEARRQVIASIAHDHDFTDSRGPFTNMGSYPLVEPRIDGEVDYKDKKMTLLDLISYTKPVVKRSTNNVLLFATCDG